MNRAPRRTRPLEGKPTMYDEVVSLLLSEDTAVYMLNNTRETLLEKFSPSSRPHSKKTWNFVEQRFRNSWMKRR